LSFWSAIKHVMGLLSEKGKQLKTVLDLPVIRTME